MTGISPSSPDLLTSRAASSAATYMDDFENIVAKGKEVVMTKEYKPQVANEFEHYLNPQSLKRHVFRSEKVRKIIEHYAQINNCSVKHIEKQVKDIIDEIGLERNLAIIRWCGMAITAISKRILSGIYVNARSIRRVRDQLGRNPVCYLPSHRSYMDFVLMSYICFYYDIEIPGIAAGMDFHAMFGMGTMLRKTGAFFMRRSFSNDELYWDIFREYMYALISVYHIGVEFFIEGTRSRNFKALVPKVGLLSMALLPYFTGEVTDVTIVPVSISYERLLEEQLFVYELLGLPKPKETTKGFFKALKIIDERFGKMYLDFGAPISARKFFGHTGADRMQRASVGAHLQKLDRKELDLIKKLGNEVIYQQQRGIVISTFNLLCLYYASQLYVDRSVNIDELALGIAELKRIFEELGAHVATDMNRLKFEIIETVEIHSNIVNFQNGRLQFTEVAAAQLAQEIDTKRLKAHALLPQIMAVAVPTLALQLYINPCMFWLARPAYLILAALQLQADQQKGRDDKTTALSSTYEEVVENLLQRVTLLDGIFKHEFIIESNRDMEEFNRNLLLLSRHGMLKISSHNGQISINENECMKVILSSLAPFLCVYYQLAVAVNEFPLDTCSAHSNNKYDEFSSKDVLIHMQKRIENLMQQQHVTNVHPYCLALDNLNIALNSFQQTGYIEKNKESGILQHAPGKPLRTLEAELLCYCQLLPFKQYYRVASVQMNSMPSKL
ncbi:PREDICTED: dihydroxyacetone phosphate acyltransferase [Bactrocera latifrons]|uniref:Dihydroxyacetone phosphate acyltransferase n=1 Tax=Bactrocera latifrons TaxID=174628 RepID=A0A0K8UN39_BACLA|nr:PREDICTED: dihydroxyacetone phosphate acyltransferase [Bactrocera latifrons]XP_018803718.1 PREDICTED: dihydroxyacetone phosphate acyltransferase [Bactrocera latifrons]XP_018803719.1 PREDICTED: dihydroxyacetone phosphate acyltransferase [Bactrocera latifrons]